MEQVSEARKPKWALLTDLNEWAPGCFCVGEGEQMLVSTATTSHPHIRSSG